MEGKNSFKKSLEKLKLKLSEAFALASSQTGCYKKACVDTAVAAQCIPAIRPRLKMPFLLESILKFLAPPIRDSAKWGLRWG